MLDVMSPIRYLSIARFVKLRTGRHVFCPDLTINPATAAYKKTKLVAQPTGQILAIDCFSFKTG